MLIFGLHCFLCFIILSKFLHKTYSIIKEHPFFSIVRHSTWLVWYHCCTCTTEIQRNVTKFDQANSHNMHHLIRLIENRSPCAFRSQIYILLTSKLARLLMESMYNSTTTKFARETRNWKTHFSYIPRIRAKTCIVITVIMSISLIHSWPFINLITRARHE